MYKNIHISTYMNVQMMKFWFWPETELSRLMGTGSLLCVPKNHFRPTLLYRKVHKAASLKHAGRL